MKNKAKEIAVSLGQKQRTIRTIYISSYIPRKCGIATFTKDLTNSINALNPLALAEILAVSDPDTNGYAYPWEVKYRINQEDHEAYLAAADYVNNSSAEIVVLQHEFGLYGGKDGEYILDFLASVKKKIVTTLHTTPENPTDGQRKIIEKLFQYSDAVVVMIDPVVERLQKIYKLDTSKVVVIHHGVPDIPFGGLEYFKEQTNLSSRTVMTAINLISPNKGFEYAIGAIPEVVKAIPDFLFLIIGETHPVVKLRHGEDYRESLQKLVKDLNISKHVRFVNRYLSLKELLDYLRASDFYITPYLDPQQIASGTLSYAVGAGKVCISTPYLYAQEVLNGNRGILVPFKDSKAIAKAVKKVTADEKYRAILENEAYRYGRLMTWSSVALSYLDLFNLVSPAK